MTIKVVRIDDRLIHGQIVQGWLKLVQIDKILVVSDEVAKDEMQKNELIINDAISMQFQIIKSANDMKRVSVELCNKVYKPMVFSMKKLVDDKCDWNLFTNEEKLLVENTILIVRILHYLNNMQVLLAK